METIYSATFGASDHKVKTNVGVMSPIKISHSETNFRIETISNGTIWAYAEDGKLLGMSINNWPIVPKIDGAFVKPSEGGESRIGEHNSKEYLVYVLDVPFWSEQPNSLRSGMGRAYDVERFEEKDMLLANGKIEFDFLDKMFVMEREGDQLKISEMAE